MAAVFDKKAAYKRYREKHRDRYLRAKRKVHAKSYGLTDEEFDSIADLLDNGPCEICGKSGRMHIDHDHKTRKFRGLLCKTCNWTLGHMHDDPQLLRNAAEYLEAKRS